MQTGSIIRGCILNEDAKKESEIIAERVNNKVNELSEVAKENFSTLLGVFTDEMYKKIKKLEDYKADLEKEFSVECEKKNENSVNSIRELEEKYKGLLKKQEDTVNAFMESTEDTVKELMLLLFEKFFYRQYEDPENLKSIVKEGLKQLEDSKNVQISLNKKLLSEVTESEISKIKEESSNEVTFKSHTSETLIMELKSEQNNIEIDFEKQMDKIKEVINNF